MANKSLYVGNMAYSATETDILFEPYGPIAVAVMVAVAADAAAGRTA